MQYIFLIASCILFSCKKDLSCESCIPGTTNTSNAKVVFTGPIEGDGCSWTIFIDNKHYHPDNLSQSFEQNELNVIVKYELTTDTFGCGIGGTGLPVIHLISIRPKFVNRNYTK